MEAGWSHVTSMMEVDGGGQLMQMDLGMTMSRDAAPGGCPSSTLGTRYPTIQTNTTLQLSPATL